MKSGVRVPELVPQVVALARDGLVRLEKVLELALRLALADLLALHLLLRLVQLALQSLHADVHLQVTAHHS